MVSLWDKREELEINIIKCDQCRTQNVLYSYRDEKLCLECLTLIEYEPTERGLTPRERNENN